jgi:hypothetical protein
MLYCLVPKCNWARIPTIGAGITTRRQLATAHGILISVLNIFRGTWRRCSCSALWWVSAHNGPLWFLLDFSLGTGQSRRGKGSEAFSKCYMHCSGRFGLIRQTLQHVLGATLATEVHVDPRAINSICAKIAPTFISPAVVTVFWPLKSPSYKMQNFIFALVNNSGVAFDGCTMKEMSSHCL